MERGTEGARKEARERVPTERVKDAAALARELRWRIRLAVHGMSEDEGDLQDGQRRRNRVDAVVHSANGAKRKHDDREFIVNADERTSAVKNLAPKVWDKLDVKTFDETRLRKKARRPSKDLIDWTGAWMDWENENVGSFGDECEVERKGERVARVRRTPWGIERQRLERTVEVWRWPAS